MNANLGPLTTEDLDRGWKEIEVEDLAGNNSTVRLSLPGWRRAREIGQSFAENQDGWTLLAPCLPENLRDEKWLDRLTPESTSHLHTYAVAMLCGNSALTNPDTGAPSSDPQPPTPR